MYNIKRKEAINIKDGSRLGFVSDVVLDEKSGRINSLIVPAASKFFGLLGGEREYKIDWGEIKVMGADYLLIDTDVEKLLEKKQDSFKI
ncbi:MAG: YlmC/YmxH family sporulation protein [Clostridiales bacterium]|nr:YlmC/YmxH family sporulation protein [Clostridiales bacterium]